MNVYMSLREMEFKIVGHLTKRGDKARALNIWYDTLDLIRNQMAENPLFVVEHSVRNLRPVIIVTRRKRGGTIYQLPYIVQNNSRDNSTLIALRWIVKEAFSSKGSFTLSYSLAKVLMDLFKNQGILIKRKLDLYDLALKNRVYVRFLFPSKKFRRVKF
jgi:small subunit ribosomal protein S7